MSRMKHALTVPVFAAYCYAEATRQSDEDTKIDAGQIAVEVFDLFEEHGGSAEGSEGDKILAALAKTAREDYERSEAEGETKGKPGKKTLASTVEGVNKVLETMGKDRAWFDSAPDKERAAVLAQGRTIGKVLFAHLNVKKA